MKNHPPTDNGHNDFAGWGEYRRLVLEALKRLEADVHELYGLVQEANRQLAVTEAASMARWEALDKAMKIETARIEQRLRDVGDFRPVRMVVYGALGAIVTLGLVAIFYVLVMSIGVIDP